MDSLPCITSSDRRYLDLLETALLGMHNPETGSRIRYLLECIGASPQPGAAPRNFNAEYFANIGDNEPEVWQALLKGDASYPWDRILGFPQSMVGPGRIADVERAIRTVDHEAIPGDFLETGVWRGGVGIYAKALYSVLGETNRTVWMADSFQGLPAPELDRGDPDDLETNWVLSASLETVKRNFSLYDLLDDRVRFIEGWFAETMPIAPVERLSVLRLDGDYYSSTIDVLRSMYPKLSPGGFVLVDDYGAYHACRDAVHDYLVEVDEQPEITCSDWTGAWWRKQG